MKTYVNLLFFVFISFSTLAQNKSIVKGNIYDNELQEAIPYATIALKIGDQVVTGTLSDDNGQFQLEAPNNKYTLEVQFIGYLTKEEQITIDSKVVDLGKIYLQQDAVTLDDVEIIAEQSTIEQKIDRKVIHVGKDLASVGATASEIMNNIPSVNVDQDGNLSLRGNTNVRVLVDGKPTNLSSDQVLKQIPSGSIKSIELITSPSAKYNPEGMSGIINIVLHKKTNDGFNATVNSGVTLSKHASNTNSIDLNYRKNKINFFANANNSLGKSTNKGEIYRTDQNSTQLVDVESKNRSYLYKVGLDYNINDKNTLSFYTNQSKYNGPTDVYTENLYPDANFENIYQTSNYKSNNRNSSYNLAYKHLFDENGHNLDVEVNYNDNKGTSNGYYQNDFTNSPSYTYTDATLSKGSLTTINIDYVKPINEKTKLELGLESKLSRTENYSDQLDNPMIPVDQRQVGYNYDYNIYSGYVTFGQKLDKFSYQVGTRVESYKVTSKLNGKKDFSDDYVTLYPSAFLGYDFTTNDMLQLSYSRRVDRPGVWQTRPIRQFSTPTLTSTGNPELRPQFTNSLELNYTRILGTTGSITGGVFYRQINDEINQIILDDPENENPNALLMTYDNFDKSSSYGFELSANLKLRPWLDIQPAIDLSSIKQNGLVSYLNPSNNEFEFIKREINVNSFNARLNANFKATNKLRFNLFGFFRGPMKSITGQNKEMHKIDFGARYSLLNNKLSISMRLNDIFNTMKYRFTSQYPFENQGEFSWNSRSVYIGVNYSFGGGKGRAMARKARENNQQQSSSGGGLF
ncbi:TonB-dependent receptor [Myroides sp. LJL116]